MKQYVIGVDVGGTKVAYGLFNGKKQLISKYCSPSNASLSAEEFFDCMVNDLKHLLEKNKLSFENLTGLGIGMPSYILFEEGRIIMTTNLTLIEDFLAKDYLLSKLGNGIKVVIDNDAHVGALAEHRHGAGRGFKHMLYCPVSTGISCGIIINNQLFRGSYGWAGESGHMIITPDQGLMCGCQNRGCFMSCCSGSMIVRHILKEIEEGEKTILLDIAGDKKNITAEHINIAYEKGDKLAIWAIEQMAKYLGIWVYNLYSTLNINCFVFGGGLTKFGNKLFNRVQAVFESYDHIKLPVYLKFAELGDNFGIIGAAELIF